MDLSYLPASRPFQICSVFKTSFFISSGSLENLESIPLSFFLPLKPIATVLMQRVNAASKPSV